MTAKGKWLILDRLAAGCRKLSASAGAWLAARDLKEHRGRAQLGRFLGGVLSLLFVGGTVYALSRGLLLWGSVVVALLSAWVAGGPQQPAEEDTAVMDPETFLELLHDLADGGNLHLSRVREQLAEEVPGVDWHGPATVALCDAAGVPVRRGVRVPGASPAVTTGIHRADLPPLPRSLSEGAGGAVVAGHTDNNNSNTPTRTEVGGGAAWINKTGPDIRQAVRK